MMYGWNGSGTWWMVLMPLLWIALIGLIVWAVVRLVRPGPRPPGDAVQRDTALDILDRRYAAGDIDTDAYLQRRAQLAEQRGATP